MKILITFFLVVVLSATTLLYYITLTGKCTESKDGKETNTADQAEQIKPDMPARNTVASKAEQKFDSALYYLEKQIHFKSKRDAAEILYIRTEDDKYRIEGNRYVDSSHAYAMKLQSLVGGN